MASLSSLGVGSGLDAETIVTKLVALEKQPADTLTTKNTKLQTQVSTWGKIQSNFSALQDAASKLMGASPVSLELGLRSVPLTSCLLARFGVRRLWTIINRAGKKLRGPQLIVSPTDFSSR